MNFRSILTTVLLGSCATLSSAETMNVRAYVDGLSDLVIQGDKLWWHHLEWSAPGLWNEQNHPTTINGHPWYPTWTPELPIFCNDGCNSSTFNLQTPLNTSEQVVTLSNIEHNRTEVAIIQQPNQLNDYTLIIRFDDSFGGADWYDISVEYDESPIVPALSGCLNHSIALLENTTASITGSNGMIWHAPLDDAGCYTFSGFNVESGDNIQITIDATVK